jgi:colanic acid biosynthesis glycosyl transferase WcaI
LKVIFLNRYFYPDHSATSQMLADLAFDLAARGQETHVITSRQRYDNPWAGLPPYESVAGVRIHRVWTSRFGRGRLFGRALDYLTFYSSAAWRLARLAARGDRVVAKTDPPLISIIAAVVARLRGAVLVNWIPDVFPEVATALGVRGISRPLARGMCYLRDLSWNEARHNVVLGERTAEYLTARGLDAGRITVIPNWADGARIRPVRSCENRLRRAWGLAEKFVVGYSGNMGRAHEFGTIIEAVERLRDEPGIGFLFIGDGPQREAVAREARRRRLGNLVFRPYQPRARLKESLGAADVHLISLRPEVEGWIVPSKLYGIAAAGRPTLFIGAAEGEIASLLHETGCGVQIAPGDAARLSGLIREWARHPEEAARRGRKARAVFEQRFGQGRGLQAWRRLLLAEPPTVLENAFPMDVAQSAAGALGKRTGKGAASW